MIREDIQAFHQDHVIIVQSNKNFFSFSKKSKGPIEAFCTSDLTSDMLAYFILSGIVSILSHVNGNLVFSPKFGYDMLKMEDLVVGMFEKYDL